MRLLLGTHTLLWWLTDDPKLPTRVAALIEDEANDVAISPVSAYELRFKALKGLLPGGDTLAEGLAAVAAEARFDTVPIRLEHAVLAGSLPLPHRDPFDRLIAAQAILGGFTVLSVDAAFDGLGAARSW